MKKTCKVTAKQRLSFALSMRDAGLTYQQIATEAIKKFGKESLPKGYNKRLVCLDTKRELNSNSTKKLNISLRYSKILEYRRAGLTFQQILQQLKEELGEDNLPQRYTERHVCRDLKRYLKKINTQDKQEWIEAKDLHRQRLNFLLNKLWPKAIDGDYGAIDRTLRIIEALSKLDSVDNVTPSTAASSEKTLTTLADVGEHVVKLNSKGIGNGNKDK